MNIFFKKYSVSVTRWRAMLVVVALCAMNAAHAGGAPPVWITHPAAKNVAPVVLQLRKQLEVAAPPTSLWIHISADVRFVLYINGKRVVNGPSTSDLAHWRYKRLDIAPYLRVGGNDLAAVVWNFSRPSGPLSQISARTGFYFKAEDDTFASLNSGPAWRVKLDAGRKSVSGISQISKQLKNVYYVASAPEVIDAAAASWGWATGAMEPETAWLPAVPAVDERQAIPWTLSADPLPDMLYKKIDNPKVVRTDYPVASSFPATPVTIPANSRVKILLDQGVMVAGYPSLSVMHGKGATIKLSYAEALYDAAGKKGQRDEVKERVIKGIFDTLIADGAERTFEPLYWRVWRYMELEVETKDAPLTLKGMMVHETGYPFDEKARFVSNDAELNKIWQIGWRTQRIDAHETYMDSSYWEQLQYVGDTRLQMLISYAVSGDDRLAVNAIDQFGWSDKDGLTEAAYPSKYTNVIAPFSLLWIAMLDDYVERRPGLDVVARNMARARVIMAWYDKYLLPSNLLGKNPTWNFVDWIGQTSTQRDIFPSYDANGESCLTTLFYLGALQQMGRLEQATGDKRASLANTAKAAKVKAALRSKCWSKERGLFADDPSLTKYSQHGNALAIIYDVATAKEASEIFPRITSGRGIAAPQGVIQTTYYFSWYLVRAGVRAGYASDYMRLLDTWRELLAMGFTTWPEEYGDTRSDTHAWSAHPTADLLEIVAGVGPAAPGYARVRIAPHLGKLTSLDATVPTPAGVVSVSYRVSKGALTAIIDKPADLPAVFSWQGRDYVLKNKRTRLRLQQGASRPPKAS